MFEMEIFLSFFLYLTLLLVSFSLIFSISKRKYQASKFPPGSKGWPIIGENLEFEMLGKRGQPEQFINDRTKRYSDAVFQTSLLGENMAVFLGSAGNKFLFSSQNKYVTSWWPPSLKKVLVFPEDHEMSSEEYTKTRSLLSEFLKPEALQRYVPIMDSMGREHLEIDWSPYKEVKVFPLIKKYSFALACRLFFCVKDPETIAKVQDPFTLVTTGMLSIPINLPGTAYSQAIKGGKLMREQLLNLIRKRKMELMEIKDDTEAKDLLTKLLLASNENGKGMNEKEIAKEIIGLLVASHDTTSSSITSVVNYLTDYPHIYREVLKEQLEIAKSKGPGELLNWEDVQKMKYSWCVACEAMRLCPPAQGAFREVATDFTYAGFTIPKGWKTFWSVHSTHKNPKYFPEPEKFDPSRFEGNGPAPYTFVPFGGGPRMCPGKEYARLQILVFMHNLVTKFKLGKVDPNERIIYKASPIPVKGLPIRLEPIHIQPSF